MQINNNSLDLSTAIGQISSIDHQKTLTEGNNRAASGERVELSNLASRISTDPSWLDQLRAAYQAGTHKLSADQIANSVINDALQAA